MPTVLRPDPFSPVLLSSESLVVSDEQKRIIQEILKTSSSDSKFAEKAYAAILYVLTAGSVNPPVISSLSPSSAVIGDPSFTLHVMGTGFDQFSTIVFAGQEEPTTFVSVTELTTGVNMDFWHGPDDIDVYVKSPVGVVSDSVVFTFSTETIESQTGSQTQTDNLMVALKKALSSPTQASIRTQDSASD